MGQPVAHTLVLAQLPYSVETSLLLSVTSLKISDGKYMDGLNNSIHPAFVLLSHHGGVPCHSVEGVSIVASDSDLFTHIMHGLLLLHVHIISFS